MILSGVSKKAQIKKIVFTQGLNRCPELKIYTLMWAVVGVAKTFGPSTPLKNGSFCSIRTIKWKRRQKRMQWKRRTKFDRFHIPTQQANLFVRWMLWRHNISCGGFCRFSRFGFGFGAISSHFHRTSCCCCCCCCC